MKTDSNSLMGLEFKDLPANLLSLLTISLDDNNISKKIKARKSLVNMGRKLIPYLQKLLLSKKTQVRMEAAKILEQIADYKSIPLLISLLDDSEFDIRWVGAKGLIKIGRRSIIPILKAVRDGKSSYFLNLGAHHVLIELLNDDEKQKLGPLLDCLENSHALGETAPTQASNALKTVFGCKT